jgi:hypothetical protein
MIRERLATASLIALLISLFIHPILVRLFYIPDGIATLISGLCFVITIILASLGKGIVRIMVFVCLAIIIIPFLFFVILLGTHLDI